jgi:hypothetical protein
MFDELLASLENTITEARSVTALLGSELRESTSGMGKPGCSFFDPMRSLGLLLCYCREGDLLSEIREVQGCGKIVT